MNHLNSLLIEGRVKELPVSSIEPDTGKLITVFKLENIRYYGPDNDRKGKKGFFEVHGESKIAKEIEENCTEGRGVRVVGSIEQTFSFENGREHSKIIIVANHIEFKPQFNRTGAVNMESDK